MSTALHMHCMPGACMLRKVQVCCAGVSGVSFQHVRAGVCGTSSAAVFGSWSSGGGSRRMGASTQSWVIAAVLASILMVRLCAHRAMSSR